MTPIYDSGWQQVSVVNGKLTRLTFEHGLGVTPAFVEIQGREDSESTKVFTLNNERLVSAVDDTTIVIDRKVDLHCKEVRVVAHGERIFDEQSPFDGRVKKELDLKTPWLNEVDAL